MKRLQQIDTWVFDLDNCLYPASSRLFDQVATRITDYVKAALNLDHDSAKVVQREYFLKYGTTLRGLMEHHQTDPQHYLSHVHDVDYGVIPPSAALRSALEQLPGRRLIFTAGSHAHVNSVLVQMGLEGLFEGVFDISDAGYYPKPQAQPYDRFFAAHQIDGARSVFFEDTARNLEPAKQRGMATVLVETDMDWAKAPDGADYIDFSTPDLPLFLADVLAAR